MRTRGTEITQVLVEHAVIEGRHERRRQDQIGDAILERQESLADFSRLYEIHRETALYQRGELGCLVRIGDDDENQWHVV